MERLLNGKRHAAEPGRPAKRPSAMVDIGSDEESVACSEEVRDAAEFMEYIRSLPLLPLSCMSNRVLMKHQWFRILRPEYPLPYTHAGLQFGPWKP